MNISQAAKKTGLSAKQIRDYEKAGLLPHTGRTLSGYRFYTEEDLARLTFIFNARRVGFSLTDIGALLNLHDNPQRTSRDVKRLTERHIAELEHKISDLQSMLAILKTWNRSCCGNDKPDCPILAGLGEL